MRSSFMFIVFVSVSAALLIELSPCRAGVGSAAPPAGVRQGPVSVMVLPFRLIGAAPEAAWISEAVDEDLSTDLLRNRSVSLIAAPAKLPANRADALAAGRLAGATYVLYGTYQFVNDHVRVTGSLIDVATGAAVAPLSATGSLLDLFQLEDDLSAQLQNTLPAPPAPAPAAFTNVTAPPTIYYSAYQAPPTVKVYTAPDAQDYSAAPYVYPDYNAGYLVGGVGFISSGFYGGRVYHYGHFGNRGGFFGSPRVGFSMSRGGFGSGAVRGGTFGAGGFHGGGRR